MESKGSPPKIAVGIMDRQTEIFGQLERYLIGNRSEPFSGKFSAKVASKRVVLFNEKGDEICRSPRIELKAGEGGLFSLHHVTIGNRFHWERMEDQTFPGDLILRCREDGTICAINEVSIEDYLASVISSEMNPNAPIEFLKVHAVLSRSWVLSALNRKKRAEAISPLTEKVGEREIIRWYDRIDHDLYDVCADDHCQRYQGMKKVTSPQVEEAIQQTYGLVLLFQDEICDTRYSKACGGITENFETAWEDKPIPYLRSISDGPLPFQPLSTEAEAEEWILSMPEAYCNLSDERLLKTILPDVDCYTKDYFRWKIEYSRKELEEILREKSEIDFGTLKEIVPLQRGPSGRICRLKVVGSKKSIVLGKELEIRRWLSRTHLYSSAFIVKAEGERILLYGAGWGHGVGLCQIGAAVMATKGFKMGEILKHYFPGTDLKKIY